MPHSAVVPVKLLQPLLDQVERLGLSGSHLLERVAARIDDPGLMLPYTIAVGLFDDAVRAGGGEDVGLRSGAAAGLERLGAFGQRLRRAPTVAAALDLAVRQRHNSGERCTLSRCGDEVWFLRHVTASVQRGRAQEREMAFMFTLQLLRLAAGASWRPTEIRLEGEPPAHADDLAALAAQGIRFGATQTAVVFPARILALPLPLPDADGNPGDAHLPVAPTDFVGSLRATVEGLLQLGELGLGPAAEAAGMSSRSLQRRLASVGLSFAELVDDVRFRHACLLLRDPQSKVVAVSVELGYTDSANFTRAFRRWAGVSPRTFRRALSEPAFAG